MKKEEIKRFFKDFYQGKNTNTELKIDFNFDTAKAFEELSKEFKKTFSAVAKVEVEDKVFLVSDPYLNLNPDLKTFTKIASNAVFAAKNLLSEAPKLAVLSAVELVNLNMESALYGAIIEAMGKRGQLGKDVFAEGPLSMDVALSEKAAKEKKVLTDVAGKANVLLCHRTGIAKGIIEGLQFIGKGKITRFITDGSNIFKAV